MWINLAIWQKVLLWSEEVEDTNTKAILKMVYDVIDEKRGEDIVILDVRKFPILTDYFVIASVDSKPQIKAVKSAILEELDRLDHKVLYYDKSNELDWTIIDANDIVIHLFRGKARYFYDLEGLWVEAERVKIDEQF